jgi:hypothetical protein
MVVYARNPVLRTRQQLTDAIVLAGVAVFWWLGNQVNRLVHELEAPGRFLQDAGSGAAGRVDDLPVVGDRLASPFEAVARAGVSQQDVVADLALWSGRLVALLPIAWLLVRYLPGRVRWAREAAAGARLLAAAPDGRLFALRAMATLPLTSLERVSPDPVRAYEAGDHGPLATLELRRLGLA